MSKLRTAVVGVGYLGRFHAQKHKALPEAELVAVVDRSPDRAAEVASELGVRAVTDYRELLGKIDAVSIAADTSVHFDVAKFFLDNKVHVFVEKPITARLDDAEVLCQLAMRNHLVLQVGHIERFNPAWTAARPELNDPLYIRAERLAPFKPRAIDVDVVLDLMIHDIDLVLSLTKSKVKSISAVGAKVVTGATDIADARVEFESGLVAHLSASRISQTPIRKFRVYQGDGYRSIDLGQASYSRVKKGPNGMLQESVSVQKADALLLETQNFFDSILNERPPVVTGRDGMAALRLAEQICDEVGRRQSW